MSKVRTIQDYYEQIYEKYPTVPKSDIKRILQYGWKSFYLHNSYGGDVLINRDSLWLYSGWLTNNSLLWYEYYIKKMAIKLRVMYKRKKIQCDGYYYFALTKNQYEKYLQQKNTKGRPKKKFKFEHVILYKIYDECSIVGGKRVAIFRIPMRADFGFTLYKDTLITDEAELILERDPLKLDDILLSVYKYQFISDNLRRYTLNKKENERKN